MNSTDEGTRGKQITESATPIQTKKPFPNEAVRMQLVKVEKDIEKTVERILVSKDRTGRLTEKLKTLWKKKEAFVNAQTAEKNSTSSPLKR